MVVSPLAVPARRGHAVKGVAKRQPDTVQTLDGTDLPLSTNTWQLRPTPSKRVQINLNLRRWCLWSCLLHWRLSWGCSCCWPSLRRPCGPVPRGAWLALSTPPDETAPSAWWTEGVRQRCPQFGFLKTGVSVAAFLKRSVRNRVKTCSPSAVLTFSADKLVTGTGAGSFQRQNTSWYFNVSSNLQQILFWWIPTD